MNQRKLRKLIRESIFQLNEKTMDDVSIETLKPEDIKSDWESIYLEGLVDRYRMEAQEYNKIEGLDDMDYDEVSETKEYKNWLEYEVGYEFENAKSRIETGAKTENGKLKIWREITVDDKWWDHFLKEGKRLGIFWSWEKMLQKHTGEAIGKKLF